MIAADSKCRVCRRVGQKLFLKSDKCFSPKCTLVKKSYPPGIHGRKILKRRLIIDSPYLSASFCIFLKTQRRSKES